MYRTCTGFRTIEAESGAGIDSPGLSSTLVAYPPSALRRLGCGAAFGRLLPFQGVYQAFGLVNDPFESLRVAGNWQLESTPGLIGM